MRNTERWLRSIVVGMIMSVLRVMLVSLFPIESKQAILEPSLLFESQYYLPILLIVGTIVYSMMTYSYFLIDFRMPGTKSFKTLQFVLCEAIIWLIYNSEPLPHIVGLESLVTPIKLILIFMVQILLIQYFVARERLVYRPNPFFYPRGLAIFTIVFALFRLVAYVGFDIYALEASQLLLSLTWSLVMGFGIGLAFSVLQRFLLRQDRAGKVIQFALMFFALNSIGYHIFILLRYNMPLMDLVVRSGMDILAVWLATSIVVYWQIEEKTRVNYYNDVTDQE